MEEYLKKCKEIKHAHKGAIRAFCFSQTSKIFVSGGDDGRVRSWDLNGRPLKEYARHKGKLYSLSIAANENILYSCASDGKLLVSDLDSRKVLATLDSQKLQPLSMKQETGNIINSFIALAIVPDETTTVAIIMKSVGLILWDWDRNETYYMKGQSPALGRDVATNKNNNFLAANSGKAIYIFNLFTGELVKIFGGPPTAIIDKGNLILFQENSIGAGSWGPGGHRSDVTCLVISDDGRWLFSGGEDCTIRRWNLADFADISYDYKNKRETGVLKGHTSTVMKAVFVPSTENIISCGLDNTLRVWNFNTTEEVFLQDFNEPLLSMAISDTGSKLAIGSNSGNIIYFDRGNI